jgi:GDP-L-fucose synthase
VDGEDIVNVGAGRDLPIAELAAMVAEVVGCQGEIRWDKTKPDGTPRKLLDIAKITSRGWIPQISLRQGLENTYAWYQATVSAGVETHH